MTETNSGNSPTMAEAFCEKHLLHWTEYGHLLTDWRDPGIFTDQERMIEHRGLGMVYSVPGEDPMMFIAVFQDRSWVVQSNLYGGRRPELGTGKEEGRFLDLIHGTLQSELEALADARGIRGRTAQREIPATLRKGGPRPKGETPMTVKLNIAKRDFDRVRRLDEQWRLHPNEMRAGRIRPAIPGRVTACPVACAIARRYGETGDIEVYPARVRFHDGRKFVELTPGPELAGFIVGYDNGQRGPEDAGTLELDEEAGTIELLTGHPACGDTGMNATTTPEARDILRRAADAVESEPHRWIRCALATLVQGERWACAYGLIRSNGNFNTPPAGNPGPADAAARMLAAHLGGPEYREGDQHTCRDVITAWNDSSERTVGEVIAALRAAAAQSR